MVGINCDPLPVASIGLAGSVVTSWRSCGSCCGIVRRWAATTVILHPVPKHGNGRLLFIDFMDNVYMFQYKFHFSSGICQLATFADSGEGVVQTD